MSSHSTHLRKVARWMHTHGEPTLVAGIEAAQEALLKAEGDALKAGRQTEVAEAVVNKLTKRKPRKNGWAYIVGTASRKGKDVSLEGYYFVGPDGKIKGVGVQISKVSGKFCSVEVPE